MCGIDEFLKLREMIQKKVMAKIDEGTGSIYYGSRCVTRNWVAIYLCMVALIEILLGTFRKLNCMLTSLV